MPKEKSEATKTPVDNSQNSTQMRNSETVKQQPVGDAFGDIGYFEPSKKPATHCW